MQFHQLILGNVSNAVLLLVICFLNDLKIAQYETFPSSLFWRTTEGELTLFCFAGARICTVYKSSGGGTSYGCCQRQCNEGTWPEPELKQALVIVGPMLVSEAAVSVQDMAGLGIRMLTWLFSG